MMKSTITPHLGIKRCKIKALRAKTNTYIKTPVRGEEPVFVVTGRKEDVAKAKREILSAAEHFSLIRATRKPFFDANMSGTFHGNNCGANNIGKIHSFPPSLPGQVTIQVRVPYRVVGLVVGPKGATIKHIQHQTHTYIVTPSREKEPIFEVSGLPDNVQSARKQIEAHIALRTGNLPPNSGSNNSSVLLSDSSNDTLTAHSFNVLSQILNDPSTDSDILVSLYKTDSGRTSFECGDGSLKIANKAMDIQDLELLGNIDKLNFNTEFRKSSSVKMKPHSLPNLDNILLQNLDSTRQFSDYVSGLINNCNLKEASSPASDLLTDLELQSHNTRLQHQQNLYPPSKSIINNQLLPSPSLSPLQANQTSFVDNVGPYMQTISFSNNLTPVYNAQSTACASITSAVVPSNIKNGNPTTHNSNACSGMARSCSSASSTTSSKSANNSGCGSRPELINIWKNLGDSLDMDEGIGDSPSIWNLPASLTTLTGSHCSPSTSISPTDSLLGEISAHTHQNSGNQNRLNELQLETNNYKHFLQHPSFQSENSQIQRRDCFLCKKKEITPTLAKCGHNMFCMDCANRICELGDSTCPACNLNAYAMRILA
ncbi:uncharacterized protein LOC111591708 [Ceratitis capitata]|uniref:uncharacterized protein LOC111591708 n=1 Tax=Ceratitis capitata TaxID=7213 RepID=UPI000C6C50A4|nr:uncharacterized protein LOC111591708 [Ceratitis capitata]